MIVSMVGVRIPFASLLSHAWGADAIWWSFPLGTITSAALTTLYYRYGGWRRAHMLDGPLADAAPAVAPTSGEAAPVQS
jgi:Na+-driven multidrug efflux pump